jgi:heme/copper-type cytochrome/quinol oxidase subunit 2
VDMMRTPDSMFALFALIPIMIYLVIIVFSIYFVIKVIRFMDEKSKLDQIRNEKLAEIIGFEQG